MQHNTTKIHSHIQNRTMGENRKISTSNNWITSMTTMTTTSPSMAQLMSTALDVSNLHPHHHRHIHTSNSTSVHINHSLGTCSTIGNHSASTTPPTPRSGEDALVIQAHLNQIDTGLQSKDPTEQIDAAKMLRHLLSSERELLIRQVLEKNWTPRLLDWLRFRDRPTLQVEALWALTNIAAGATDNTSVLLQHGVIPTLVSLLDTSNDEVLEQAVWVLGNLSGEGSSTRDLVIQAGALPALVKLIRRKDRGQQQQQQQENSLEKTEEPKQSLLRILTWTLSNLCDGQPRPVFNIQLVLPELEHMLESTEDSEILSHVCWALSHLCDGPSTHIQAVVKSNVCRRLVELLQHRAWRVTKPALRAIGNIVCAEDDHDYTQHIIDCGAVPSLRALIGHSNREIQKEACWTLSNIAAGTVDQIQCVVDSGSIPTLIQLASNEDVDAEVKSEACWVVLNATSCGSDAQIEYLVNEGCVSIIKSLLSESSMIMMALEGLERILQVGDARAKSTQGPNPYARAMACIQFKDLVHHASLAVSKRASRLWTEHFVKCTICECDFSKQSNETSFCDECKCFVCCHCDCSIFHLSYQELLWKAQTDKETNEQKAKQASKRNKRQKKRERTKERKAAALRQQVDEPSLEDIVDEIDDGEGVDENEKKSTSSTGSRIRTMRKDVDDEPLDTRCVDVTGTGAEKRRSYVTQNITTHPLVNVFPTTVIVNESSLDTMVNANDELVSYLNATGSIMALAERLEQEDLQDRTSA